MSESSVHYVDGLPIPLLYSADKFRSGLAYKPNPDDLFLVTYPKCGTTWTGQILLLLLQKGEPLSNADLDRATYLEIAGAERIKNMSRPGVIKSHLPFSLMPWSGDAKYIFVARNPKDCCVSFFNFLKHVPGNEFKETFDQFFEYFMTSTPTVTFYCGDYFDHLLSWYSHKNDSNVLFVTYEELKEDIDAAIMKMASFIDDEKYAQPIRENPDILGEIKKLSSLKEMKENFAQKSQEIAKMTKDEFLKSSIPNTYKDFVVAEIDQLTPDEKSGSASNLSKRFKIVCHMTRKGVIGDWKNYFSDDQSRQMDEKFKEMTKGTDLPNIFMKYM